MTFAPNKSYLNGITAYLGGHSKELNEIIGSSHISQTEKRLLTARLCIRRRDFVAAKNELNFNQSDNFYEAEKNFLLGNISGFQADWDQAIQCNLTALDLYKKLNYRRGQFISSYNLSVDFNNVGLLKVSENFLLFSKSMAQTKTELCQILRALACLALQLSQPALARRYLTDAFKLIEEVEPSEKSMLMAVAADIYFKLGDQARSLELLQMLRYSKTARDKGRVLLDVTLLEKLCNEKPPFQLLTTEPTEVNTSAEYSLKWRLIQALQSGDLKYSNMLWNKLVQLMPMVYQADYQCTDQSENASIFMNAVNQIRSSSSSIQSKKLKRSKVQILIEVLQAQGSPIRKEELIEKIWNVNYDPSYDARFYKLIERVRKDLDLNIENRNHSYFIAS